MRARAAHLQALAPLLMLLLRRLAAAWVQPHRPLIVASALEAVQGRTPCCALVCWIL